MDNNDHVTRAELSAFRLWIEERFRSLTWKLALAAFVGGALSNVISGVTEPVAAGIVVAAGAVGYAAKLILVALLHR